MIYKTHGIIISNIPFGEKSVITKVYTEMFGLLSFIVNGVRGGKGVIKPSHIEMLNRVEIVIYKKGNDGLHRIKELETKITDGNIKNQASNIVALFISEVLQKALHEHEVDEKLFLFLDEIAAQKFEINPSVLSLYFLIRLSNCLGILSDENDVKENKISFPENKINEFLQYEIDDLKNIELFENDWRMCIDAMVEFLIIHVFQGKNLKTFLLLKECM